MKIEIYKAVKSKIQDRLQAAQKAMADSQAAANEESKSSAGDKYETGRAMAQNDRDLYARQQQEALNDMQILDRINPEQTFENAMPGALVSTSMGNFYLSVSIGIIEIEKQKVIVTSVDSPLGKLIYGKEKGDIFNFQGKNVEIKDVI